MSYDPQRGSWCTDDGISVSLSADSVASRSSSVRTTSGRTYKEINTNKLGRRSRRGSRVIELEIEGGAPLPYNYSTSAPLASSPPRMTRSLSAPSKEKEKKEKKGFFKTLMPTRRKEESSHKKQSSVDRIDIAIVDRSDSVEERSPATSGKGKGKARAQRDSFGFRPTPSSSSNGEDIQPLQYRTEIHEPIWVSQARDDKVTALEAARLRYQHWRCEAEAAAARGTDDEEHLYGKYVAAKQVYKQLQREYTASHANASSSRPATTYHGGATSRTFATRVQDPTPGPSSQPQRVPPTTFAAGTGSPSLQYTGSYQSETIRVPPEYLRHQDRVYPAGRAYRTTVTVSPDAPRRQDGRYTFNDGEIIREDLRPTSATTPSSASNRGDSPLRRQDGRYTYNPGEIARENLRPAAPPSVSTASMAPPPSSTTASNSFATALESRRRSPSTAASPTSPPPSRARVSRATSPASRAGSPLEPIVESGEERVERMVREQRARRREEGGRGMSYDA